MCTLCPTLIIGLLVCQMSARDYECSGQRGHRGSGRRSSFFGDWLTKDATATPRPLEPSSDEVRSNDELIREVKITPRRERWSGTLVLTLLRVTFLTPRILLAPGSLAVQAPRPTVSRSQPTMHKSQLAVLAMSVRTKCQNLLWASWNPLSSGIS